MDIIKKYFARHRKKIIGAGIVVAILFVGGIIWYVSANSAPSFGDITAVSGNIVQSVDESGNVLAENNVNLSFEEAGQIDRVYVKEGDTVQAGAVLAKLDSSIASAQVSQAKGVLAAAQAKYDDLASGTRPEELRIDTDAVSSAATAMDSASNALSAAAQSAYVAADDAVRNQIDSLFINPRTNNPIFSASVTDSQMLINIENQRLALGAMLDSWYATENATSSSIASLSDLAGNDLKTIKSYCDTIALAVNNANPNSNMTASVLAGYKGSVAVARNEITQAIASLTGAKSAFNAAQSNMTIAQSRLALSKAGATEQELEVQKAVVLQAQAVLQGAQVMLDHADLIAPFYGTVRNVTAKVGQVVSVGASVLSLTNESGLKTETYVSEADVAKVKQGNDAQITLDAYGAGTLFPAKVTTVDVGETQINGSPAYKITLHFANQDLRVKPGMTANVHIITAEHNNVIGIPSRLIINDNDHHFVLVKNGGTTERREVVIGITGQNSMVEIVSGLNVGEKITNF